MIGAAVTASPADKLEFEIRPPDIIAGSEALTLNPTIPSWRMQKSPGRYRGFVLRSSRNISSSGRVGHPS